MSHEKSFHLKAPQRASIAQTQKEEGILESRLKDQSQPIGGAS